METTSISMQVHKVATIHNYTFKVLNATVSGMLNLSLSMSMHGAAHRFRVALRRVIEDRVRFINGVVPAEAVRRKMLLLKIFLSTGKKRNYKATVLTWLPNGDWRNDSEIEYYPRQGDHEDVINHNMASALTSVLFGSMIHRWPRHRWRGADIATSQIALLCACHGILRPAFEEFMRLSTAVAGRRPRAAQDDAGPGARAPLAPIAAGKAPAPDGSGQGEGQPQGDEREGRATTAEDNERFRSQAIAFIRTEPLGLLIVIRLVMEPLRRLLDKKLALASARWELHQQACAARHLRADGIGELSVTSRFFRLGLAADNRLEDDFYERLVALCGPALWEVMPHRDCTESMAAQTFRMISLSGALVEVLLRSPHRHPPYLCFKLLADPSVAETLQAESFACMLDDWSAAFVDSFRGRLDSTEARMHSYMAALLGTTDIARLEALHASIRRLIYSRVQTAGLDMEDCSALWSLGRHRAGLPRQPKLPAQAATSAAGERDAPRAQGGEDVALRRRRPQGGPWRLFCRKYASGRQGRFTDWSEAKELYRQLPDEEMRELRREERCFTQNHVQGATSERGSAKGTLGHGPLAWEKCFAKAELTAGMFDTCPGEGGEPVL